MLTYSFTHLHLSLEFRAGGSHKRLRLGPLIPIVVVAELCLLGTKAKASKAPTIDHVDLETYFSGRREPHINLVLEVLRKIDVANSEDRLKRFGRRGIAQEHSEEWSLGVVVYPRGEGSAAPEFDAIYDRVNGGDGVQGVDVETNGGDLILAYVEYNCGEGGGGREAEEAAGGGGREGEGCWGEEESNTVAEDKRVVVDNLEGEGGGGVRVLVEEGNGVVDGVYKIFNVVCTLGQKYL